MRVVAAAAALVLVTSCSQSSVRPANADAAGSVLQVQEGFVDARGVLIYFTSFGTGDPLLILHGGPGATHDYFLPHLLPLARTNRLVFIDERGSGRSQQLEDAKTYTIENMVEDVEAVRNRLKLGRVNLLGHSYGGALAQAYAFKYQQNLSHLVLASTFYSTRELNDVLLRIKQAMPADARNKLEQLERAGLFDKGNPWEHGRYPAEYAELAWGRGYFPYLYGARPDPNFDPQALNASAWDVYREMWGSHGEFIVDGNLRSVEYGDRLSSIHVPTLITVGEHDQVDPAIAREMQHKIPGAQLVVLPNAGHMTFVDQPQRFVRSVDSFLHSK